MWASSKRGVRARKSTPRRHGDLLPGAADRHRFAEADCGSDQAATGMRQAEAVGLEWSQVDLKLREVTLYRTKTNRPRVVPLSAEAVAILERQPRHISRHSVFHADGRPFRNFASRFAGYARKAGVRFRCHDLRHKFAIDHLRENLDLYRLQIILGHSSLKQTEEYLDYLQPSDAEAAKRTNIKQGQR